MVYNYIVIFGRKKSSSGGILIVHLCTFSCKDKVMVGYNVLEMYLRTIGVFCWHSKGMWKKIKSGCQIVRSWNPNIRNPKAGPDLSISVFGLT